MLDNKNEIKKMIENIERERNALKMALVDACSNQVVDILCSAYSAAQVNAVKVLYQLRFSETERATFEKTIGSEKEMIELIVDEADGAEEMEQVINVMEKISVLLTIRHLQVKKIL